MGMLGWTGGVTCPVPNILDFFIDVGGVQQIAAAWRCILVLAKNGKVYMSYYTAETPVCDNKYVI